MKMKKQQQQEQLKSRKNDNERITNKITNVINNGNGSGDIQQPDAILHADVIHRCLYVSVCVCIKLENAKEVFSALQPCFFLFFYCFSSSKRIKIFVVFFYCFSSLLSSFLLIDENIKEN